MDDRRDPMVLWVGTWAPEDVIDRETRRLTRVQDDRGRDPQDDAAEGDGRVGSRI